MILPEEITEAVLDELMNDEDVRLYAANNPFEKFCIPVQRMVEEKAIRMLIEKAEKENPNDPNFDLLNDFIQSYMVKVPETFRGKTSMPTPYIMLEVGMQTIPSAGVKNHTTRLTSDISQAIFM